MESCGRYIVLVMTFEVATHFLKCISCSITPQTPIANMGGHFYLARTGHYYLAATLIHRIIILMLNKGNN